MRFWFISLFAGLFVGLIWAQSNGANSEIRGLVIESGVNHGVADAEVGVFQKSRVLGASSQGGLVAKTTTDSQGAFRIPLSNFGEYIVSVSKEGYTAVGGSPSRGQSNSTEVVLVKNHPSSEVQFVLGRPGEVTGSAIDEETGMPLAKARVQMLQVYYTHGSRRTVPGPVVTTDNDGNFTASLLRPGDYLIAMQPRNIGKDRILAQFSEDDASAVDRDFEESYWPGGSDLDAASPMPVNSGATVNAGTLRVRKSPYYRVRVSIPTGDCTSGEQLRISQYAAATLFTEPTEIGEVPCGKDFLLRNFRPGSYWLEIVPRARRMRAMAALDVADHNMQVSIPLQRGFDIQGRIIADEGVILPRQDRIRIGMSPIKGTPFPDDLVLTPLDAEGRFRLADRPLGRHRLEIGGIPARYFIKEVRYNGVAVSPGSVSQYIVSVSGPATMEIVLGDKSATLTGTVADNGHPESHAEVLLIKWPVFDEDPFLSVIPSMGDDDGKFQLKGLAPGEYRIFAVPQAASDKLDEPGVLQRLLERAERITLNPSDTQNVTLKLTDPSR